MTITDTEGFVRGIETTEKDAINPFKPNKRIEIAATEETVESIIASIKEQAHTGRKGDGFVVVVNIEDST